MNNEITEELIYTTKLIKGSYKTKNYFEKYCPIYTFTTENIKGILDNVVFENKEILLVCSSGDHILNAILHNPKKIVAYDINALTKHIFELKKAAILELDRKEFLNFFFVSSLIKSKKTFNKNTYNKIKKNLSLDSKIYWDYIYDNYSDFQIRSSQLFKDCCFSKSTIQYINPYLSEKNYLKLREKIKDFNLEFINSDIHTLSNKLKSTFDYIYLSNIAFYFNNKTSLTELKQLVTELEKYLNKDGQLGIIYLYNYKDEYFYNTNEAIYNSNKREEYFPKTKYSYTEFPSTISQKNNTSLSKVRKQDRDSVLTLKIK